MLIFPAIDIKEGRAVRLFQGDFSEVTVYADDPAAVARGFAEKGAKHLHVVDLDGALGGDTANFDVVARVAKSVDMFIEVGGGIRDEERIKRYLGIGASRVILGTAAVRDFDFTARMARKYGGAVAVGVDARDGAAAVSGWTEKTDVDGFELCARLFGAGVKTVIYTDISRDGAERGANLAAYRRLAQIEGLEVIASGGISSLGEIKELKKIGARAAVLGKALYTGAIDLSDALAAAREE